MKIQSEQIILLLLAIVIVLQFIQIYLTNNLLFYGQLTILAIMFAMLIYKSLKNR